MQYGFIKEPWPQTIERYQKTIAPTGKKSHTFLNTYFSSNSVNINTLLAVESLTFHYFCLQTPYLHYYNRAKGSHFHTTDDV